MADQIFISYSKKDNGFAHKLADDLEAAGFKIWIDKRSIEIGDEWRETIERNLRAAGEVIVNISRNALESEWVPYEGALAIGWEKSIYPLVIDEVPSFPPWLVRHDLMLFNFFKSIVAHAFDIDDIPLQIAHPEIAPP